MYRRALQLQPVHLHVINDDNDDQDTPSASSPAPCPAPMPARPVRPLPVRAGKQTTLPFVKVSKAEYNDQVRREDRELKRSLNAVRERAIFEKERQDQACREKNAARQRKHYWKVHGASKQPAEVIIDIEPLSLGKRGRSDGSSHNEGESENERKRARVAKQKKKPKSPTFVRRLVGIFCRDIAFIHGS
jgi:hypothetical protein